MATMDPNQVKINQCKTKALDPAELIYSCLALSVGEGTKTKQRQDMLTADVCLDSLYWANTVLEIPIYVDIQR